MKLITAYKKIKELKNPLFRTSDFSIILGVSNKYGSKLLKELSLENLIIHLKRDLWLIMDNADPFMLPDYLTAPMPSYISLQSALHYHGLISQIPNVIYAVSIARTKRYKTLIGTYSIHHINPNLFIGFDTIGKNDIRMAQPEKALFDFFYFKTSKTKLFYSLPEIEISTNFNWAKLNTYTKMIINKSRSVMVQQLINKYRKN